MGTVPMWKEVMNALVILDTMEMDSTVQVISCCFFVKTEYLLNFSMDLD